jgi:hypothetical protein
MRFLGFMTGKEKEDLNRFSEFLDKEQIKEVRSLGSRKKAGIYFAVSKPTLVDQIVYPQLNPLDEHENVLSYIADINEIVLTRMYEKMFHLLAKNSDEKLYQLIGRGIDADGPMRSAKKAVLLQLFSPESLHILFFTDDEDFRDLLMGNVKSCAPKASVYTKDKYLDLQLMAKNKGLLALADEGVFIVGEFRCEKKEERVAILSAMDEGWFIPEKKGVKKKVDARISTLAFATSSGLKLVTSNLDILHTQVPFDRALLPRFHIVFVVQRKNRASDIHHGMRIQIEDVELVRRFITFAKENPVSFDPVFDRLIERNMHLLKEKERFSFVDITEKTAQAIRQLACCRAMMHLRPVVEEEDVNEAVKIVRDSLFKIGNREQGFGN